MAARDAGSRLRDNWAMRGADRKSAVPPAHCAAAVELLHI
jgi:hypothetical protein